MERSGDNAQVTDETTFHVTLAANGKRFEVRADETVLEGARRAGLALPYSCLGGTCGSCKATILAGELAYRQPPLGLDAAEAARHEALLCQAMPRSDLSIVAREVPSAADVPCRMLALKVARLDLLAPDVMGVYLMPPRGTRLRWLAGQYLDVLLAPPRDASEAERAAGTKRRAVSIANAPEESDHIELHVRRVPGGGFTEHVFTEMKVGDVLRIEGPLGTFVPREDSERPMLFVAGGTGFAPIKAIIEHFFFLGTTRAMHLYWGARHAEDIYLPALPAGWVERHPAFGFTPVLSDAPGSARGGLVHEAVLEDHPDLLPFDVYMSGPPGLIDAARRRFVQAGLDESRLYYDSFEYAPDVLAAILAKRAGVRA